MKRKTNIKNYRKRHGEKFHETLLTKEELKKANDLRIILKLVQIIEI